MTEPLGSDLLKGVSAIGAALGFSRASAARRIADGQLPTFKIGGTVCARRSTIAAWLADAEARAQAEREGGRRDA